MSAEFSITSDLAGQKADPAALFAAFGAGGFSAIHWCQDWIGEPVFYSERFAEQIARLAADNSLRVADVHAFGGTSDTGITFTDQLHVAMDLNRAEFAHRVGANVLVVHLPCTPFDSQEEAIENSVAALNAIRPACEGLGVRVAIENLNVEVHTCEYFDALFDKFPPEFLGFCYDSGHAILSDQADLVVRYADRLIATHLHDNDGSGDQHRPPGEGIADWEMILRAINRPDYRGTINLEVHLPADADLVSFCKQAHAGIAGLWNDAICA